MSDSVAALPMLKPKLPLYCLRLTDKILVLDNSDVEISRNEGNETLQGYVMDLHKFEPFLKHEMRSGNVDITGKEILTDKTFEI